MSAPRQGDGQQYASAPAGPPGPPGPTGPEGPAGPPGAVWTTVLDVDFSSAANQPMPADGVYTIGGVAFTKFNTASESAPMAVVHGSGLVITPSNGTNYFMGLRSLPGVTASLTAVGIGIGTTMRVSMYLGANNPHVAAQGTILAIEHPSAPVYNFNTRRIYNGTAEGQSLFTTPSGVGGNEWPADAAHQAKRMILTGGIASRLVAYLSAPYAGGALPVETDWLSENLYVLGSNATEARDPSEWNLMLGAFASGVDGTPFVTTIARVTIEAML